jgi:agmatine deiminase
MNITRKNREKNLSLTYPQKDGFYMPSELYPQAATWLGWPSNKGTFNLKRAQLVIEKVARIISKYQKVYIVAPPHTWKNAVDLFKDDNNIFVVEILNNDAWLRDIAPTFLIKKSGKNIYLRGLGWQFNGWGKPHIIDFEQDALVSLKISKMLSIQFYENYKFICEGGSYSVDGNGTLITTEECLLNKNRNKNLSRSQIENILYKYLNVNKIIWLPYGIAADTDTDGHVDNICVFVGVGKVILSWPKNCGTPECEDKEQEMRSIAALNVLENSTDCNGNKFIVYKIPHPPIISYTQKDIDQIPHTKGSYERKVGTRFDASHINLIITNKVVVVPTFNCSTDKEAIRLLAEVFPTKKVVGVYAKDILMGGGNIHCMSQQQPLSTHC